MHFKIRGLFTFAANWQRLCIIFKQCCQAFAPTTSVLKNKYKIVSDLINNSLRE